MAILGRFFNNLAVVTKLYSVYVVRQGCYDDGTNETPGRPHIVHVDMLCRPKQCGRVRHTKALFSSQKILQNFSDLPSYRIFRRIHGVLNIDKNKN